MLGRLRYIGLRRIVLVVLFGFVVGIGAFLATSTQPIYKYLGFCGPTEYPGFDPWSGLPHGATFDCSPASGATVATYATPTPDFLVGRQAIPVPVGFVIGGLATAGVLLLNDRRRRPNSASLPAARDHR